MTGSLWSWVGRTVSGATRFSSGSADAAGGEELLAGEPAGVGRGQEHGDRGDVADLARTAERGLLDQLPLEVRADEPAGHRALGLDHPRVDRVDADAPRAEFLGEHAGDRVDRALGAGVHR